MAINKNFVVKNGLEVNENLIVANATDNMVGVGTSTPNNTLHVFGGIGATDVRITGVSSFIGDVKAGSSGTIFTVIDSSNSVGVGTDQPAYLLDIRGPVSTGYTSLYVQGDVRLTGDLIADDLTFDQATLASLRVTGFTTAQELVVGFGASVAGITTLGNTVVGGATTELVVNGDTYIAGDLIIRDDVALDTNLFIVGIATIGLLHVGSGFTAAGISTFLGHIDAQSTLNVGSAATISGDLNVTNFNIGAGGTIFKATGDGTVQIGSGTTNATVTINGASVPSIGLVVALGG